MGGPERAPQAPRAWRAPGNPGRASAFRQAPWRFASHGIGQTKAVQRASPKEIAVRIRQPVASS
jgi:hypothetical protein